MQKLNSRSKSSLFLIEMLLSLLIFALACTACVKIFASARLFRQQAREWNHIQELTSNTGEFLEGWNKDPDAFLTFFPQGQKQDDSFNYYYDTDWKSCSPQEASYKMNVRFICENKKKTAMLCFSAISGKILYETKLCFPNLSSDREDVS